jgi:glutathionylspermidine synthase
MQRRTIEPRPNWRATVESQGFAFHTPEDQDSGSPQPYWDESACYVFTEAEIAAIESATEELRLRCLDAVQHVIDRGLMSRFGIPQPFHAWIAESWNREDPTLYGRFDLAFGGGVDLSGDGAFAATDAQPKLLEYNADTPTSLLEAAVIQWYWLQDTHPHRDQFNSLHEKLIDAWKWFGAHVHPIVHFTAADNSLEDYLTLTYLRDTAQQAGLRTTDLPIAQLGLNRATGDFVGLRDEPVRSIFKLYPWEWMLAEPFAPALLAARTRWIEPPWKMLLSNKALLPVLWELFPNHPNLLEARFGPLGGAEVRKPILSREGSNVSLLHDAQPVVETEGPYPGPHVYQRRAALACSQGRFAVIGSWIVGDEPAGMGIREDASPITGNLSRFVPHLIE